MQNSIVFISFVMVAACCLLADAAPQDLGSPIRIAQCRALCLDKFVRNDRHETLCQQDPDCFTCWENCGLLQDNPTVWSRICNQPSVCFPGCLQACQFFQNADLPQKDPVMPTSAEPSVQLVGNLATWPRPSERSSNSKREKERLVYAVIQKQSSGRWRQIIQTAEERCFLPSGETPSSAAGNLRVLAVGGRGLVALYRPEHEDSSTENAIAAPLPASDVVVDTDSTGQQPFELSPEEKLAAQVEIVSVSPASPWKLREVSLIHQKVLVIAEVAWPVQRSSDGQSSDYLVTWEVDGGGLKGHLYTDATSVTLSLWPDTVYHIQVDLVTATSDAIQMRSAPLTIDTHKAPGVVQSDEARPLPAAPLIDRLPSSSGSSSGSGRRLEATVGVGAAAGVSLFLLVLATAIGIRRHRRASMRLSESPSASPLPRHHHRPSTIESLAVVKTIDGDRVPYHTMQPPCAVHSLEHCLFPSRTHRLPALHH
ncbi:uncharacterized protein LOC130697412 [Daphnia carinata]|uniref:uncharacterized protein LOC130697412 n=1 Tax=Daphnia carinata TaxID=120202 RepID=UPI00257DD5B6|nr:uncharacterized protein LOC130697412 [Daphnia carinata]